MSDQEKLVREIFGLGKPITELQFNSLHLWFKWMADTANGAGITMQAMMDAIRLDLPVTPVSFKEAIFKPIMASMYYHKSTKDLLTKECVILTDSFNAAFGERLKIHVPFPNEKQTKAYLDSLKSTDRSQKQNP